ncbi:MAG: cellobiose phosphorylase [Bacilli bacterium]|nr:cellobiose phosphorylase [Bacilli bacterium]
MIGGHSLKMKSYYFDQQNRFVISNYNGAKTFSSFLPGIAGIKGKPMWVFYVNRGQAISSFGVRDKDGAIIEFYPANKSVQLVQTQGFRTFIKQGNEIYEPFAQSQSNEFIQEKMQISPNMLELESIHEQWGLSVKVTYFTLPNESFAALVRQVTITNLTKDDKTLEVLDGLPLILPYGLTNQAYKELSNTLKSWMDVYNMDEGIPYYKLRASIHDSVEVSDIHGGHFYLSFTCDNDKAELIKPIVDSELIFGRNDSLSSPDGFIQKGLKEISSSNQMTTNKVPCGFSGFAKTIQGKGEVNLYTLVGHISDIAQINQRKQELVSREYVEMKKTEAGRIVEELTDYLATETSTKLFDAYCKQNYLDNVLRGGHPILLENGKTPFVYHIYSRKHGDLERDYNFFSLDPSYYSQGNGNFRDTNQNRRCDVLIHPEVKDYNIVMFMSLIQADGYNPLIIKGCSFTVSSTLGLMKYVGASDQVKVEKWLSRAYTPGELLAFIEDHSISLTISTEQFLMHVLNQSEQFYDAEFGEGYWIDHWTYNLDLIVNYLAIYPDQKAQLLFGNREYMYFDSPAVVCSRAEKYVLAGEEVRQYGAIHESEEKRKMIEERTLQPNWMRINNGRGEIYRTLLYEKLLSLALNKFTTIDPEGIGIEMEANKPGWNDSLNGLPGLFASGFSELCELKRVIQFLLSVEGIGTEYIELPEEIADLLFETVQGLDQFEHSLKCAEDEFRYWDFIATTRERYRVRVKYGIKGTQTKLTMQDIEAAYRKMLHKVNRGIDRAFELGDGMYPTYFYYEATAHEPLLDEAGKMKCNAKKQPFVRVTSFQRVDLPYFLEGPTKAMKILTSREQKLELYKKIKNSELYDKKLKMYKVNASLEGQTQEIGRSRAFTAGWLENESVFLHMEYKYLLELLKGKLYGEFYEEMQHVMIPFMDPEIYGRSTVENSSFIASSANPDPSLHGRGFVARLSGSTAEFLSIWNVMMFGERPFVLEEGQLKMQLHPLLPEWLFDRKDQVKAKFLGHCDVIYHNPNRRNTYDSNEGTLIERMILTLQNGEVESIAGSTIQGLRAHWIRNKQVKQIEVYLT